MMIAELKCSELFNILKQKKFKVKKDLSDYILLIETIFNKKIYPNQYVQKQIMNKICFLKRQWKILQSKSSGPKYINFNKKLDSCLHIRLTEIDFGNINYENLNQLEIKMQKIKIDNSHNEK